MAKAKTLPKPPKPFFISREERRAMLDEKHLRCNRLRTSLIVQDRPFPGTIIISEREDANKSDPERLADIQDRLQAGLAAVFWVDGSLREHCMSTAVVWNENFPDKKSWCEQDFQLGRYNGDTGDAEVHAAAAALGLAANEVQDGKRWSLVRVYSDHEGLLKSLQNGRNTPLGPLVNGRFALQDLYELAEWLAGKGIGVELIWVKGHKKSMGNNKADRAAARSATAQASMLTLADLNERELKTIEDVPNALKALGPDFVEERLWRRNKSLYDFPKRRKQTGSRSEDVDNLEDDVDLFEPGLHTTIEDGWTACVEGASGILRESDTHGF
jgi:ribonuclease HI